MRATCEKRWRLLRRASPPGRGTFHFENLIMPPLPKTCPKMVLPHKGDSLWVKDVFEKKFLVPGEIRLAARSHRFFRNTLGRVLINRRQFGNRSSMSA